MTITGVGAWLILRQKTYIDSLSRAVIEVEVPLLGKLKTNYPAIGVLLIGALIAGLPLWYYFQVPARLVVAGRVSLAGGKGLAGVPIGILPGSNMTWTQSDGRYMLKVPRSEGGESYQAVTFLSNANPPEFVIGVVGFDSEGRGVFDHEFGGRR